MDLTGNAARTRRSLQAAQLAAERLAEAMRVMTLELARYCKAIEPIMQNCVEELEKGQSPRGGQGPESSP